MTRYEIDLSDAEIAELLSYDEDQLLDDIELISRSLLTVAIQDDFEISFE